MRAVEESSEEELRVGSKRRRQSGSPGEAVVLLTHIAPEQGSAATPPEVKVEDQTPGPSSESSLLRLRRHAHDAGAKFYDKIAQGIPSEPDWWRNAKGEAVERRVVTVAAIKSFAPWLPLDEKPTLEGLEQLLNNPSPLPATQPANCFARYNLLLAYRTRWEAELRAIEPFAAQTFAGVPRAGYTERNGLEHVDKYVRQERKRLSRFLVQSALYHHLHDEFESSKCPKCPSRRVRR